MKTEITIPQAFYDWCINELPDPDCIMANKESEKAAYMVWQVLRSDWTPVKEKLPELTGLMLQSINGHEPLTREQKTSILYFMETNFTVAPGIYKKFHETFPDYQPHPL